MLGILSSHLSFGNSTKLRPSHASEVSWLNTLNRYLAWVPRILTQALQTTQSLGRATRQRVVFGALGYWVVHNWL